MKGTVTNKTLTWYCFQDIQTRVVEDLEEDYLQYIDYLKKEIRKTQEKTQEKFSEIIGK